MKRNIIATALGFVVMFLANTVLAITVIGPLLNDKISISRNPEKDELNIPSILLGYFMLTLFLVWFVVQLKNKGWLQRGFIAGSTTGLAVFVAGHLIISGWSVADAMPMFCAGLIDSFATVIAGIVIALILKPKT